MRYIHNVGTITEPKKVLISAIALVFAAATSIAIWGAAEAGKVGYPNSSGSVGKVTFNTNVYASQEDEMDYGDGIPNGEWIVSENQGVKLGLRATNRTDGLLGVDGSNGNRIGVYNAPTGFELDSKNNKIAEWNYEWSVDLSEAEGRLADKYLSDYTLTLDQDFNLNTPLNPIELPMSIGVCDKDAYTNKICQQSWNPSFFASNFDFDREDVYSIRLTLVPKTFNGAPLAVAVQVNVTNTAQ